MNHKTKFLRIATLIGAILLVTSVDANAQVDTEAEEHSAIVLQRLRAEKLEKAGKYLACGQAYLDIYKKDPNAVAMDEVLYNAGLCFEDGKSVSLAVRMYGTLEKRFPNSYHVRKALLRLGNIYGGIASYQQAAPAFERYARRYPREYDAANALNIAVTYRMAIGDNKKAIANIETFIMRYGKKRKLESLVALFRLAGIYKDQGNQDAAIKVYKRYIRDSYKSRDMARMLIANAMIGELLWKQSCKGVTDDGVCIKQERARARRGRAGNPPQCGPVSKVKRTILHRDSHLVQEAMRYFKAAMTLVKKGAINKASDEWKAAATYWMAASKFYINESRYEKFLAIEFPSNLRFSNRTAKEEKTRKESSKRLAEWIALKTKFSDVITQEYLDIKDIKGGGASWAIASVARSGQLQHSFANALWTAEIPRRVRTGPDAEAKVKQHCTIVTADTARLEERSATNYSFCLKLSHALNYPDRWSLLCASKLTELRPADYPRAREVHGRVNGVSDILDTEALLNER